jgi:SEC-C motif-containing protein
MNPRQPFSPRTATPIAAPCPCGLPQTLAACCGRWMTGIQYLQAPDAQRLMRSRYSAFVGEQADYLRQTWHPSSRPAAIDFEPGLRWLGLQVLHHRLIDDRHASVEFVARNKLDGRAQRLHEISRFVLDNGRWFYLGGEPPS